MSEDKFWDDALVAEFTTWSLTKSNAFQGRYADIEEFKKSKGFTPTVERDFEILSLKYLKDDIVYPFTTEPDENFIIHSVKRLSDGVTFSIGEKFDVDNFRDLTINGIVLMGNKVISIHAAEITYRYWVLSNIKKATPKKILGTTHDGVICYEGDMFPIYMVCHDFRIIDMDVPTCQWAENKKYFATEAAAQEYITFNKPLLSVNNIISYGGYTDIRGEYVKVYVKELVDAAKSKIQQP